MRRLPVALVAVVVLAAAGAALLGWSDGPEGRAPPGGRSPTATASPSRSPQGIPPTWKLVADGQVLLSVPAGWAVDEQQACPGASRSGEIDLGPVPPAFCPVEKGAAGWVVVQPGPRRSSYQHAAYSTTVNGLVVDVDGRTPLRWYLVASGLELVGSGPDASAVLHSVRALTWASLPRSLARSATPARPGPSSARRPSSQPVGYGRLLLSAPVGWSVEYAPACHAGSNDAISLGYQEGNAASCPAFSPRETVSVTPAPTGISIPAALPSRRVEVHGIVVEERAYREAAGAESLNWVVPSLGVQLSGAGPDVPAVLRSIRLLPTVRGGTTTALRP